MASGTHAIRSARDQIFKGARPKFEGDWHGMSVKSRNFDTGMLESARPRVGVGPPASSPSSSVGHRIAIGCPNHYCCQRETGSPLSFEERSALSARHYAPAIRSKPLGDKSPANHALLRSDRIRQRQNNHRHAQHAVFIDIFIAQKRRRSSVVPVRSFASRENPRTQVSPSTHERRSTATPGRIPLQSPDRAMDHWPALVRQRAEEIYEQRVDRQPPGI